MVASLLSESKGKEKLMDIMQDDRKINEEIEENDSINKRICGICLEEGSRSTRGWIDSCNHHFCFVCIMEWSRVESRCPTCKQRFKTIRRPAKPGVFDGERVVDVPSRNQVYDLSGNVTVGADDPYAEVVCCVCYGSDDEDLLLLCDLCDSAAHTYCVGLGITVPEDDWYCDDCFASRIDHTKNQSDVDACERDSVIHSENGVSSPGCSVDVSVKEVSHPDTQQSFECSTKKDYQQRSSVKSSCNNSLSKENMLESQPARTLRCRRNVHERLKTFRENWNDLQTGMLDFSSNLLSANSENVGQHKNVERSLCDSLYGCSTSFDTTRQISRKRRSDDNNNNRSSYDVNRAWRMFEIARPDYVLARDFQCLDVDIKEAKMDSKHKNYRLSVSLSKPFSHDLGGNSSVTDNYLAHQEYGRSSTKSCRKQNSQGKLSSEGITPCFSEVYMPKKMKETAILSADMSTVDAKILSGPQTDKSSGRGTAGRKTCSGLGNTLKSSGLQHASTHTVLEPEKSSEHFLGKDDNAKTDVKLLVKLNLKLACKGAGLEAKRFKEIARSATHTILAACGREHSRSCVHPYKKPTCRHLCGYPLHQESSLMPGSCRGCFSKFVKVVVDTLVATSRH